MLLGRLAEASGARAADAHDARVGWASGAAQEASGTRAADAHDARVGLGFRCCSRTALHSIMQACDHTLLLLQPICVCVHL